MFNNWHKKEKPIFTGITRGLGGFGFGGGSSGPPPVPFSASGGTKTGPVGGYFTHALSNGQSFTVTSGTAAGYLLLVAGGGGATDGGMGDGGHAGGGGGGVIIAPLSLGPGTTPVVVGSGGGPYSDGANSTFGPNWVAQGGGRGVRYNNSPSTSQGGSPGGAYGGTLSPLNQTNNPTLPADSRTYGYGNIGGEASGGPPSYGGGGGGGAGGVGGDAPSPAAGDGGLALDVKPFAYFGDPAIQQYHAGGGRGAGRTGNGSPSSPGPGQGGNSPGSGTTGSCFVVYPDAPDGQ